MGAVEILLISASVQKTRVIATCKNCGHLIEKTVDPDSVDNFISKLQKDQCSQCNNVNWDITLKGQTEEGRQIESFGGICVILRYVLT